MPTKKLGDVKIKIACISGSVVWKRGIINPGGVSGSIYDVPDYHTMVNAEADTVPKFVGGKPSSSPGVMLSESPSTMGGVVWAGLETDDCPISMDGDIAQGFHNCRAMTTLESSAAEMDEWASGVVATARPSPPVLDLEGTMVIPIPDEMVGTNVLEGEAEIAISKQTLLRAAGMRVASAFEDFSESFELEVPDDWKLVDDPDKGAYGVIEVSEGETYDEFTVYCPVYYDSDTYALVGPLEDSVEAGSVLEAALQARDAFDTEMAREISVWNQTADTSGLEALQRPEATENPELGEHISVFDDWWNHQSETISMIVSSEYTEGDPYQDYVDAGGTLDKSGWIDQVRSDTDENISTTDVKNGSWVDSLSDMASSAGSSIMSLLSDWGPLGTVGAYGGIKALSGSSSSTLSRYIPLILLVGGGLLLFK